MTMKIVLVTCVGILVDVTTILSLLTIVTSKVIVADPSTGTVASKPQQTYQLWGSPIFSNVNKNSTTVNTALGGAWGGPVSTTSQSSTAVQSDNLFSNLTIVNNDKIVVTSTFDFSCTSAGFHNVSLLFSLPSSGDKALCVVSPSLCWWSGVNKTDAPGVLFYLNIIDPGVL
jgi:hypothetical protein